MTSPFSLFQPLNFRKPGNLDVINEIINETGDDRNIINDNDQVVLIIEDDLRFARIMIEKAHERDMKAVVATGFAEVFHSGQ